MGNRKKNVQKLEKDGNKQQEERINKKTEEIEECYGLQFVCYLIFYFVLVGCVHLYTSHRSIPGGDSGELIAAAHEFGVAHPPGYPLFTVVLGCVLKLFSVGSVAWRANMFNAVLSTAASCIFTVTIYKYTRSAGASVIGSSLWTFSYLTWTWSTCVEVFCLNNFFVASLLYLMLEFEKTETSKYRCKKVAYIGSFVCGLALCNQHTVVVYVFVVAIWVLYDLHKWKELTSGVLCTVIACFLLGLVPYIYLPLSCILHDARWTWGSQADIDGFFRHLFRVEYGTFSLSAGDRASRGFLHGLSVCVQHVLSEYTIVGAVMLVVGVISAIGRGSKSLIVSMVMGVLYIILFSWRANLDIQNKLFLGVVERFWIQSDMIVVLIISIGVAASFRYLSSAMSSKKSYILELSISCVICAMQIQRNFSACNQRDNTVVAEFGSRLFQNMPNNTLVLTVGDLPSNALRYIYLCENDRPDITVLDQELLTYKWFVPKLRHAYPTVVFPGHHMESQNGKLDGQTVFNFKTFLDVNFEKRPLISCIGSLNAKMFLQLGYFLFPYGPCSILWKKESSFDLKSLEAGALNMSAGWKYPYNGYDARSWERVATNEMWSAKVNIGFKLYEMAMDVNETSEFHAKFISESYRFYKQAIEKENMEDIPSYWHRNFALACERMLRVDHEYSNTQILTETILHFEEYMKKDPTDESVAIIEKSVQKLKQYIGKV